MNKYVLRTSLVWIIVLAVIAGIWAYRTHAIKSPTAMKTPMSGDMQPVVSGPPATADQLKAIHARYENGCSARSGATHTREDAEHWCADWHGRIQTTER